MAIYSLWRNGVTQIIGIPHERCNVMVLRIIGSADFSGTDKSDASKNESAVNAAKGVGIGKDSVKKFKATQERAPDQAEKVRNGEITLEQGYAAA